MRFDITFVEVEIVANRCRFVHLIEDKVNYWYQFIAISIKILSIFCLFSIFLIFFFLKKVGIREEKYIGYK